MKISEMYTEYPTLTIRQLMLLGQVAKGTIYMTRIAGDLDMFPSVVNRNIISLEGAGLLTRTEETTGSNRTKKFRLVITKTGRKVISELVY